MTLKELIKVLTSPKQLENFYKEQGVNVNSEALIICQKGTLDIDSEIAIFPIEETEGNLIFTKDGIRYVELFEVEHTKDLIKVGLGLQDSSYTDEQIAQRLLEYRINDA